MNTFLRAAVVVSTLTVTNSALAADAVTIRVGTVAPRGTPWERQLKRTEKMLKAEVPGLKIKSYFGGAKGDEKSIVRQVRDGRLEMAGVTAGAIATAAPDLQLLELPYLFETSQQADFVLDKYARPIIAEILAKKGFVLYQLAENGWQNFGAKDGFIKSPADLKGRKMRSQESPIHIATWKAFGAAPVEMGVSEVLPALRTGLVEGFANTPLFTFATGWYQAIQYYTVSKHLYQPGVIVYSKKWFDAQPAELQKQLIETDVEGGQSFARKGIRAIEKPLITNFTKAGIKLYELTPAERKVFIDLSKKLHKEQEKKASKDGKRLLKAIREGKAAYAKQK
ncbi:MAG: TRAP transporter substrate-binding protein DctP [Myxococcota bacterium]